MGRTSQISTKFLPFSPGIPWQAKNGKYIKPEIPGIIFQKLLNDKDIVVSAFGGLFESYFSLSILEAINYLMPGHDLYWCGNKEFYPLVKQSGLASIFDNIDQDILDRFPVPIFFDKENRAYFNCLNNYIDIYSYYGYYGYSDRRPAIKQIVEKSTTNWSLQYIPQMRRLKQPSEAGLKKPKQPYILLLPDRTGLSENEQYGIDWDVRKVRSFASMLSGTGFDLIVVATNRNKYFNINADIIDFSIENIMCLLPKAYCVMSKDIDILLISLAASSSKVLSVPILNQFDLHKNAKFLQNDNDIYIIENLSPEMAWKYLI